MKGGGMLIISLKGEVHSRMAIYFLYANKKFIQKYVIHQNFSFQRALNPTKSFSKVAQNLTTERHHLGASNVCVTSKSSA